MIFNLINITQYEFTVCLSSSGIVMIALKKYCICICTLDILDTLSLYPYLYSGYSVLWILCICTLLIVLSDLAGSERPQSLDGSVSVSADFSKNYSVCLGEGAAAWGHHHICSWSFWSVPYPPNLRSSHFRQTMYQSSHTPIQPCDFYTPQCHCWIEEQICVPPLKSLNLCLTTEIIILFTYSRDF